MRTKNSRHEALSRFKNLELKRRWISRKFTYLLSVSKTRGPTKGEGARPGGRVFETAI